MAKLVVTQTKDGKEEIFYEGTGEIEVLEEAAFFALAERDDVGTYMTYYEGLNDCITFTNDGDGYHFINYDHLNDVIKKSAAIDDEFLLRLVKGVVFWTILDNCINILAWGPEENRKPFSHWFHEYEKMLTENHNMTFDWSGTASLSEDTTDT